MRIGNTLKGTLWCLFCFFAIREVLLTLYTKLIKFFHTQRELKGLEAMH